MQLFYHPEISETDSQIIFPKEESRHIIKVLRKNEGDRLNVTNGKGFLFTTEIISSSSQQCIAKIVSVEVQDKPAYYVHLAVAPTKMNDRYEWFLEKATEIGVHEITPVICSNSERKVVKNERFERVLQSAMKQSLHFRIPQLNEAISFSEFVSSPFTGKKYIAHCEEDKARRSLKTELKPHETSIILIGPEGDFSPGEIELAMSNGWIPVTLGNSRLRTETAAVVACHTASLANEEEL